ncbi:MAG: DUF2442 domain-containing protein [Sedimentisphaerales bacterium]|nr:DUF2442 domain-containing protein [Sedimentisphaerales bacterium]MBN2843374.1 DUF2442 domain-containing protein [Sedimentisphaerales bacterium]
MEMRYDEKLGDFICHAGYLATITAVEAREDYTLLLTFSNGEKKIYDARHLLSLRIYEPLKNIAYFLTAKADGCTVVWSDEIDIDPEILYEEGKPI